MNVFFIILHNVIDFFNILIYIIIIIKMKRRCEVHHEN